MGKTGLAGGTSSSSSVSNKTSSAIPPLEEVESVQQPPQQQPMPQTSSSTLKRFSVSPVAQPGSSSGIVAAAPSNASINGGGAPVQAQSSQAQEKQNSDPSRPKELTPNNGPTVEPKG